MRAFLLGLGYEEEAQRLSMRLTSSSIWAVGVLAPAVTPTLEAPSNQLALSSSHVSMW